MFADKIELKPRQSILLKSLKKKRTDPPDNLLNRDHFDARTDYWVEVFAD